MARVEILCLAMLGACLLGAAPAAAQRAGGAQTDTSAAAQQRGEIQLVYDREVFVYEAEGRRDPFRSLATEGAGLGPRFEELILRGIIFSPIAGRSVALLVDGSGKIYRARQGDLVGNALVVSIQPLRVVFRVDSFGTARQEAIDLKRPDIGGQR
jgi:hypothetical protein